MWVPQFACVLAYVAQQRYIWTSSVALSTGVAFANLIIFIIIMRDPNLLTWPVWDPHVGPTLRTHFVLTWHVGPPSGAQIADVAVMMSAYRSHSLSTCPCLCGTSALHVVNFVLHL